MEPFRFAEWWQQYANLLGNREILECAILFKSLREECEFAGLSDERLKYLFCAARALLPDMTDRQYIEVLNIIFGNISDSNKLNSIISITSAE
jgi:hypothetical protein